MPSADRAASIVVGLASDCFVPSHVTSFTRRVIPNATTRNNFSLLVLLLSGDISMNPGPTRLNAIFPCAFVTVRGCAKFGVCADKLSVGHL